MTYLTPSATKLLATDTPWRGSLTSSPTLTLIFLPRMPPASLMSAIACSAPCFSWAPNAASEPVIGPPMPNLIVSSFWPQPASARPRLQANASVVSVFIGLSPEAGRCDEIQAANAAKVIRIRCRGGSKAATPVQRAGAPVDPAVGCDHLLHALEAEAQQSGNQTDGGVHQIGRERQECALVDGELDEAYGNRQQQHVFNDVPPGPPGCRDGAAGEGGGAPTEPDGHEQEQQQRAHVRGELEDGCVHQCLPPSR